MSTVQLGVVDYILAGIFLCVSLGIGIFYGVCRKAETTDDYLYGNRKMHLLPVAVSLLVTFQSANSCLGLPAEIYTYNSMFFYTLIGIGSAIVVASVTTVPLLYPLRLNSAYEYLGLRFNSRSVQLMGTLIGMLQTLLYMSTVLFGPALALEAVAGIPFWVSVILVGVLGTIYTSLGGFRSVIWTDVFQFIILYGGLTLILVLGINTVGGFGKILDIAYEGDRIHFNASVDPRVRHSLWSCVVGGMFMWFPNTVQQSAVQRMASIRSQRDATIAFLISAPFSILFGVVLLAAGLVFYAYFILEQCGPVESGLIGNPNQVMPYFVMLILTNIPGLAGIFLAALFSGTLSSLSSGINALTANTLNDIMVSYTEKMSQARQTLLARIIVFGYGIVTVAIAYYMKNLTGTLTQIGGTAFGACGGPYFGMFCLGAMFPQANWIGALVGGIAGIIFNVWLAISAVFYSLPAPKSPPIPTSGCMASINQTTTLDPYAISQHNSTFVTDSISLLEPTTGESTSMSGVHYLYNISYLYLGLTGFLVSLTVGILVSYCSGLLLYNGPLNSDSLSTTTLCCCPNNRDQAKRCNKNNRTDYKYIFPCFRYLWSRKTTRDMKSYYLTDVRSPADEQNGERESLS